MEGKKLKKICITEHEGEIPNGHNCTYNFEGGSFTEFDYKEEGEVLFDVDIHVVQQETNSILRVQKTFESQETAMNYLRMFIAVNPVSEGVVIRKSRTEIYHYV